MTYNRPEDCLSQAGTNATPIHCMPLSALADHYLMAMGLVALVSAG